MSNFCLSSLFGIVDAIFGLFLTFSDFFDSNISTADSNNGNI